MLKLYGEEISSRLLIGTALYPSPAIMQQAIRASGAGIVTVSLRRETAGGKTGDGFWSLIRELGAKILPNTAGCRTPKDAVATAQLARELFDTPWVKLEVIGDDETLQPDVIGLVEAAAGAFARRLQDFPLLHRGYHCRCAADRCRLRGHHAMGISHRQRQGHRQSGCAEELARAVSGRADDRGRRPRRALSHAAQAMELGYDAVLLNTAIAKADDPVMMAKGFRAAVEAGRLGFEAGLMAPRDLASPSTPVVGTPFWHAAS